MPIHVSIAAAQRGLITREQLVAAGLSVQQIERRIAAGSLHRVHRGVYVLGHPALPPLGREQAALLAVGPDAALSHATAAALQELLRAASGPVELVHAPPHRRSPAGVRLHRLRSLDRADTEMRQGLRVTSVARTLEDLVAADHPGLARALDEALLRRLVRPRELTHPRLRRLLDAGATPTRSQAEHRLFALVAAARLPRPETNVRVAGHEIDALCARNGSPSRSTASNSTGRAPPSSAIAAGTLISSPPSASRPCASPGSSSPGNRRQSSPGSPRRWPRDPGRKATPNPGTEHVADRSPLAPGVLTR